MYPTLPFGPLALPTGPVLAIFAVILTLDIAGRYGRRFDIHPDDIWNTGLIALTAGLIVARLWNVFQFWYIYQAEPVLIFSIRPSGFEFWPGLIAALIGGYAYLLRRALDPVRVGAALAAGMLAGSIIHGISGYATGAILGTPSDALWALPYFGELRHPAGFYLALASLLYSVVLWIVTDVARPGRTFLLTILGYSLIRLIVDGFVADSALIGTIRVSQLIAFVAALAAVLLLARAPRQPLQSTAPGEAQTDTSPPQAPQPDSPRGNNP